MEAALTKLARCLPVKWWRAPTIIQEALAPQVAPHRRLVEHPPSPNIRFVAAADHNSA